jgi:hypothetical protein
MSTLRLTTISNQDGSATVPSQTVISGSAKAWVNFNGTGTVAIRASFNVSSITDGGTGLYTINFTTAMPDANYSSVLGCNRDGGVVTVAGNLLTVSTSSLQFEQFTTGGSQVDRTIITAAIFR